MRQVCRQQCQPHAEAVFRPVHPAEVQHRQPEEACQHAHLPDTKALCLSAENTLRSLPSDTMVSFVSERMF